MQPGIEVRNAGPSDAEQIAGVLIDSRRAFLPYAKSPHSDGETRAWVSGFLLGEENVLVAVSEGRVIGVASTTVSSGIGWISQMYVGPTYVGQGIGSLLLKRALEGLPRPVRLHTFQQNLGARRFYERHGFVQIQLSDGSDNEEKCPSALYELPGLSQASSLAKPSLVR